MPREKKATYLGTILSDTIDNKVEVAKRLAEATATANKLKIFWNKASNPAWWKIRAYDAIIRSKLLYGLECIQLTEAEIHELDAYQIKGLRRILHIPPTHIDRTWTNDKVIEKASVEIGKPIINFAETWKQTKFKTLGHVMRASPEDPLHQVCFQSAEKTPQNFSTEKSRTP